MSASLQRHLTAQLVAVVFATAGGLGARADESEDRPNILVILADGLGWGDLSLHGNREIATPHLDAFAESGLGLEHFYTCPEGATTRASLLTGRYHYRTGVSGSSHGESFLPDYEVTIAEVLQAAGWSTGYFGKWQNGANWPHRPEAQGFDRFFGYCGNSNATAPIESNDGSDFSENEVSFTGLCFEKARTFIEETPQPWFCFISLDAPGDAPNDTAREAIEEIDTAFGRLIEALSDKEKASPALVWFLSSNGPASLPDSEENRFNAYLRGGKGSVHEGGVRVPSLIRWPEKIPAGTGFDRITTAIDLFPTLVEVAGIPTSEVNLSILDGMSLAPALRAGGKPDRWPNRILFTSCTPPGFDTRNASVAVRTDRWVALRDPNWQRGDLSDTHSGWELHDLDADPYERYDSSDDYPYLISDMRADFSRWMDHTTDDGLKNLPTEIGHPHWPVVTLSPECVPFEWKPTGSRLSWPVKVVGDGGKYQIEIELDPKAPAKKGRFHFFLRNTETVIDVAVEEARPTIPVGEFSFDPGEFEFRIEAVKDGSAIKRIRTIRVIAAD
ncbi:MAG: sulfatase-like hydrolase/transferase [Verrucomicrobiae bacterium]|nr:sulfatase-like hydrolase/transferase [Verrucomicrobiae bacterium]